jgi:hypothetical protein
MLFIRAHLTVPSIELLWNHGYDWKSMKNLEKLCAILMQFRFCVVSTISEKIISAIVLVMFKHVHVMLISDTI